MLYPDDPDVKIKTSLLMIFRQVNKSDIEGNNFLQCVEALKPQSLEEWKAAATIVLAHKGYFSPNLYECVDAFYETFEQSNIRQALKKHVSVIGN